MVVKDAPGGREGNQVDPTQTGTGQQTVPDAPNSSNGTGEGAGGDGSSDPTAEYRRIAREEAKRAAEEAASGFRSVLDKQVGPLRGLPTQFQQVQAQLAQTGQQVGQLLTRFQEAQEVDLDPEEKAKRQAERQQKEANQ